MTDDDGTFTDPCSVCGESVKNKPYVSLGLFGVFCEHADGLLFAPEECASGDQSWRSVPHSRALHFECLQAYFDGVLADLRYRRRLEALEGEP